LDEFWQRVAGHLQPGWPAFRTLADILIVTVISYRLLKLVRGTRAWKILIGIAVFVIFLSLSDLLGLVATHWVLQTATLLAPVALAILLLPELRQALEGFARLGLWPERLIAADKPLSDQVQEAVVEAVSAMARERTGALIVIERTDRMTEIERSGVPLHAEVSAELLRAVFHHGNPLHDGAALIREGQLEAAACRLPNSDSTMALEKDMHLRHRAGLGASEAGDAIVIIVSEERGSITLAVDGSIEPVAGGAELADRLADLLALPEAPDKVLERVLRRRSGGSSEGEEALRAEE
jgi:diadenylate cyclase